MRRNQVFGFVLALAAAASAQSAAAQQQQPARGHEQHAAEGRRQGGRFERLFQGIQLSDAQRQQIRQLFQEGRPERGERARRTPEQRAELQKRREQQMARVRSILTAEQRAQFDRNVAQARAQRGARQGGRRS